MSTAPVVPQPSKLQTILSIIDIALGVLSKVPVVGPEAAVGLAFLQIFQNASLLYQQETGQPFSVANILPETPAP